MNGFAVLSKADAERLHERYPVISRIKGVRNLVGPYEEKVYDFNGIKGCGIGITEGFEGIKRWRGERIGTRRYGYIIK